MGCKLIFIHAVVAQLAEHQLPKLRVTSSSLAYRSRQRNRRLATLIFCFYFFIIARKEDPGFPNLIPKKARARHLF